MSCCKVDAVLINLEEVNTYGAQLSPLHQPKLWEAQELYFLLLNFMQNLSLESDPGKLEKEMKEKGQVSIILNFKHILLINFEVYSLVPMLFQ